MRCGGGGGRARATWESAHSTNWGGGHMTFAAPPSFWVGPTQPFLHWTTDKSAAREEGTLRYFSHVHLLIVSVCNIFFFWLKAVD